MDYSKYVVMIQNQSDLQTNDEIEGQEHIGTVVLASKKFVPLIMCLEFLYERLGQVAHSKMHKVHEKHFAQELNIGWVRFCGPGYSGQPDIEWDPEQVAYFYI